MKQAYPLDDLLAAVDWIWGEHSDGFWSARFAESDDPFKFFATKVEKILDRHQRLLTAQAHVAKRSSNKETNNDSSNDSSDDFNPIRSY